MGGGAMPVAWLATVAALACSAPRTSKSPTGDVSRTERHDPATPAPSASSTKPPSDARPPSDAKPSDAERRSDAALPALPEGIDPGRWIDQSVAGDAHPLRIIHGAAGTRRAIVYLHGMCGNLSAPREWADVVSRHATLVVLQGDLYCGARGRFKWSGDLDRLDARATRALEVVAAAREGQLDTDLVAIMGYSQGAARATALAGRFPDKYPWVIVAGIPEKPRVDRLRNARAIAVLGGEHEPRKHMEDGVRELLQAGLHAEFFLLPGAMHGYYGKDGPAVLERAFAFVFAT